MQVASRRNTSIFQDSMTRFDVIDWTWTFIIELTTRSS